MEPPVAAVAANAHVGVSGPMADRTLIVGRGAGGRGGGLATEPFELLVKTTGIIKDSASRAAHDRYDDQVAVHW